MDDKEERVTKARKIEEKYTFDVKNDEVVKAIKPWKRFIADNEAKNLNGTVKEDKFTKLLLEALLCEDSQQQEALWQKAYKMEDERIIAQKEKNSKSKK